MTPPLCEIQCSTSARLTLRLAPKAISRRNSYLRVRLNFSPIHTSSPPFFNGCGFGPPLPLTAASTWTWIDHPVSGLLLLTLALLRLGFPTAPSLEDLTLPVSVTRRTVLQKVRGRTYKVLPQLVDTGFQVLFHSPPGVLFTFLSQYYALIMVTKYLAFRGWSPTSHKVLVSRGTPDPAQSALLSRTGLSPFSGRLSQNRSVNSAES